jgi:photosystem II stability/assembly factor-like uncharacterized protein
VGRDFYGGIVLKTTDSGTSWNSTSIGDADQLSAVCFPDANTGYMTGSYSQWGYGKLFKTINGGTNWFEIHDGSENILRSVFFTDSNTGYVVGFYGAILKTTSGGVGVYENDKSAKPLFHIYPNPADNHVTISNFAKVSGEIIITIYNSTGRSVIHKLSRNQNSVEIDVSNLANGIYLVLIQTRDGSGINKLVICPDK